MTIAKETDLPDLLSHLGYQVRRLGSYYTTREMDSIRIKNRRSWRRYSTDQGGDAIAFLQEFCNKSFPEAVNYLLEFNGHRARDPPGRPQSNVEQPKEKPTFVLPIANQDQRRVFAYLQKRGIAPQVIRDFIQAGLLYEDALHHNCVFVGREVGGQPRFASKRGTCDLYGPGFKGDVAGSDKSVAFPLSCDPNLDWVVVFEAPIDLMSFCTLHPKVTSNALALCGLFNGALDTYLKDHPHLKRIILCLDADSPGQEAAKKLKAEYEQKGYQVSTCTPPLYKDWNEYLQYQVRKMAIKSPKTTNFEQKEANQPMADLEKLVNDKAAADTQWRELRQAERETATGLRDASINEITTNPEAYARYLDLQGDNPAYGAGNIALIMIQQPEATLFGTRDRWRGLGRFVLEDEQDRGAKIFIRSPSGRGYVLSDAYDVSQTQGREVKPPLLLQDDTREMETALTVLLRFSPVPVVADRELTAAALYDPKSKQLTINPSYSDSEAFAAIATQIAHARFHDKGFNQNYRRESYDLSAQSVSCVLCRRFGIKREAPDLSGLPDLYQGWQTQNRQKVLSNIQDMGKQIGGSIEKTIAPPQRGAPTVRHDAR